HLLLDRKQLRPEFLLACDRQLLGLLKSRSEVTLLLGQRGSNLLAILTNLAGFFKKTPLTLGMGHLARRGALRETFKFTIGGSLLHLSQRKRFADPFLIARNNQSLKRRI